MHGSNVILVAIKWFTAELDTQLLYGVPLSAYANFKKHNKISYDAFFKKPGYVPNTILRLEPSYSELKPMFG